MLQSAMDADVGPNVSSDAGNFFQSDRDLEIERAREQKKADSLAKNAPGNPIITSSKVLALTLTETQPDCAYVAESGHVARKIDLKVYAALRCYGSIRGVILTINCYRLVKASMCSKDIPVLSPQLPSYPIRTEERHSL